MLNTLWALWSSGLVRCMEDFVRHTPTAVSWSAWTNLDRFMAVERDLCRFVSDAKIRHDETT